ncbi:CHAP domain-containing protein [Enterococcus faecalis]|uniref:CHAP domain-containing protein n=1 Tax=Enterococcus faecalis TaxID=1351 RepID=UPI001F53149C|nr:CHAP domain-containing protein [Enterococcus faecalis]MCI1171878.1 CHAP domain-containing protein [Enterococcus faecalis]MCT6644676.1 CHAP domain-containing protein [Enterococcus faecalis]
MKKMLLGIVFLLSIGLFFIAPSKASADEIDDFLDKYNLSGVELDNFEAKEQAVRQKRDIGLDESAIKKEYTDLIKKGELDNTITYSEFYEFVTYPEPKDPVVEHAREKRDIQRPQAGDILVTNSTSSSPIVGHAGIYLGDGTILSIDGPKKHPSTISLFQWMIVRNSTKDTWTKVYRPKAAYKPAQSANWGNNNIRGKNFSYGITGAPTSLDPTYCSKIVFHSYWFANNGNGMIIPGRLVSPYALPNMFVDYGHADHVATYTWRNIA